MKTFQTRILGFSVLLGSLWTMSALATPPRDGAIEAGVYGGFSLLSNDNQLGDAPDPRMRPGSSGLFGGRASWNLTHALAIEAEVDCALASFKDSKLAATVLGTRGSLLWHFSDGTWRPFVLVGAGAQSLLWKEYGTELDTDSAAHAGAGLKVDLNNWLLARADVRYFLMDGAQARFSHSFAGHIGLSMRLDSPKQAKIAEIDSDGDGIPDNVDKCPHEIGKVEDQGCKQLDSDGDGIPDALDKCPNIAGKAEDQGCKPKDTDGDGIPDRLDKCPNEAETLNGIDDEDGCPDGASTVVISQQEVKILEKVNFEFGKAVIQQPSLKLLDAVAAALRQHAEMTRVVIEGHTDDIGKAEDNLALSQARAQAIAVYLTGKGVAAERLVAEGHGANDPLCRDVATLRKNEAANKRKLEACREQNRRVQFRVVELHGRPVTPVGDKLGAPK